MSFYTLAVSSSNHHSCVCLLEDNNIVVAFPVERTIREKATAKITQLDIDIVASYTKKLDLVVMVNVSDVFAVSDNLEIGAFAVSCSTERLLSYLRTAKVDFDRVIVDNSNHHLYHAITGLYMSGFDNALCLVVDGIGTQWYWKVPRRYSKAAGVFSETTTIFDIEHTPSSLEVKTLYKNLYYVPDTKGYVGLNDDEMEEFSKLFNYPHTIYGHIDIGKMYGTITRHLGLGSSNDAGKTMGLSAYGEPNDLPPMLLDRVMISDSNFFRPDGQVNTMVYPELKNVNGNIKRKLSHNLAYNVQRSLEKVFVARVKQALDIKPSTNLIIGGGCALNILGNSEVKKQFPSLNVHVEPIGSDASQAIGAALYYYKIHFPTTSYKNIDTLFLGPHYDIKTTKSKLLTLVEQYDP